MAKMNDRAPEVTNDGRVSTSADSEETSSPTWPPTHPGAVVSMSRLCSVVVEDESGLLVTVFTGRDLLFDPKKLWRAQY